MTFLFGVILGQNSLMRIDSIIIFREIPFSRLNGHESFMSIIFISIEKIKTKDDLEVTTIAERNKR